MNKYALIIACFLISGCNYSEGELYGEITKLSKRGLICKSWEGELATFAGKNKRVVQGTAIINTFNFSVTDENVLSKIKEAAVSGKTVSLEYVEQYFVWPCSHDSEYVVTGVKYSGQEE